jgi:hypothetical protein
MGLSQQVFVSKYLINLPSEADLQKNYYGRKGKKTIIVLPFLKLLFISNTRFLNSDFRTSVLKSLKASMFILISL